MPASAARRSLPPAIAAGALLAGLWFVPTTHATTDFMTPAATARSGAPEQGGAHAPARHGSAAPAASTGSAAGHAEVRTEAAAAGNEARLVRDDRTDTTPYLVGGALVLGLGAGVAYARRRGRTAST